MSKIIFVYAGHPHNKSIASPETITRELYKFLSTKKDVAYYDWCTMGCPPMGPDDVIIGHPHSDPNTIMHNAFKRQLKGKYLIFPLHHGAPEHNLPFDGLVKQADGVLNIMGKYWYDTLENSPFAHWKPKITRVDMAVDASHYPYMRQKFAPPGKRNFLYVGNSNPEKNVGYLGEIMARMPESRLHWYGSYPASGNNITFHGYANLTPDLGRKIVEDCDFFISPSRSDANPTTLLETTAWGIIPTCTKQSGYWEDEVFTNIPIDDPDGAVQVLNRLQHEPEENLLARAKHARSVVESEHSWARFCETVWRVLGKHF